MIEGDLVAAFGPPKEESFPPLELPGGHRILGVVLEKNGSIVKVKWPHNDPGASIILTFEEKDLTVV